MGGHEIRSSDFLAGARQLASTSRAIQPQLVEQVHDQLANWSEHIRPGFVHRCGDAIDALAEPHIARRRTKPTEIIEAIKQDLIDFSRGESLQRIVMVNVASTEPAHDPQLDKLNWEQFREQLDDPEFPVRVSTLYAIAAIESGCPYVNFTPSVGSNLPAVRELAANCKMCHAGRDGKTGETFLKSVLAPAFAARHLQVMSWVGHNIFGNLDGRILDDPRNKATKVQSKDSLLGNILGYTPQTHTSIEYIESLGDWKTAWDHIHFQGFLGTPMIMQFIWQGCDSILAAPLVLDLVRFADLAAESGVVGELDWLASFFKSPQGTALQSFGQQFALLEAWVKKTYRR